MMRAVKVTFSRNLSSNPEWPIFSSMQPCGQQMDLGAVSITWTAARDRLPQLAVAGIAKSLSQLVGATNALLGVFAIHAALQPRAVIPMHRKIWRQLPTVPGTVKLSAELPLLCADGVRYSGLASVAPDDVQWAAESAWSFKHAIVLVSYGPLDDRAETIEALARSAFPPDGCANQSQVSWRSFSEQVAAARCLCGRVYANLADGSVVFDLFGAMSDAERAYSVLTSSGN